MKVTINRTFPMPASVDATWATLTDIEAVASCMPGATITERVDDRHYKGTVKLKVGPAMLTFRGEIEVKDQDAAAQSLRLVAKGTDTSGTSAATLDLTARVQAADGGLSQLVGNSEATVSGKAATFGGRLMDGIADQLLKQFAANFAKRVGAGQQATAAAVPEPASTSSMLTSAAATPASASTSSPAPAAQPLSAFSLLWAVIRDWFRGLFSKRPT
jgi:carbon monoxide dehydrogenase subunit G